jgi:ubiquinone/menaquinone biosynthesis C-methylase UbiE
MKDPAESQKDYYERTAKSYDAMHLLEGEHEFALAQLLGLMRYYKFGSLLDVGAGTGRVLRHAREHLPDVDITGIEPVDGLREIGYQSGLTLQELTGGNALNLEYADNSVDIVCAFGILHHVATPEVAIREMCRVARHGVFFSDLNNFGCGSPFQRLFSRTLRTLGLWRPFQYVKNGAKYEKYSEGDGIHYSYSLFDSMSTIREKFSQIHFCNTRGTSPDLFRSCSHVSVLAVKSADMLLDRRRSEVH